MFKSIAKQAASLLLCLIVATIVRSQSVTPCLVSNGIVTGSCPPVGDAYLENNCIGGVMRQIARSVNAENVVNWINLVPCYGSSNPQGNCLQPYNYCTGNYCPDKYCQIIKSLVDLKASLITRAVNPWGASGHMWVGSTYHQAMQQFIFDVNAAYDCAGIRRPVIQGGIMENCEPSVQYVQIPFDVLNEFKYDMGIEQSYYMNANGTFKTVYFDQSRIVLGSGNYPKSPDITKIEGRMWFYHCAKLYIDLGYKSIHMGQMEVWGKNDIANYNISFTIDILARIRNYAAIKNTFVLLTEENFKAKKFPGTNTFMFDYDSRALRPREITSTQNICGDFSSTYTAPDNYLINTPCSSEPYRAIVDSGVIRNTGMSDGYNPLNNCYMPFMPYNTYFDFAGGVHDPEGVASTSIGCGGQDGTWGWDDTKWFAEKISSPCRTFWMGDAICRVRNFHKGFGFMIAPGLLTVKKPASNPFYDGSYLLADEPSVKNEIVNKWQPNNNAVITIARSCVPMTPIQFCSGLKILANAVYTMSVINPDCTTLYTWHIQNPDGSWQPFTYGTSRTFQASVSGNYIVFLRQDNLGGFTGTPDYSIKTDGYIFPLYRQCCGTADKAKGIPGQDNPENYEGDITYTRTYDLSAFNDYIKTGKYHTDAALTPPLKINDEVENNIRIYPNPARNKAKVEITANSSKEVQLFLNNTLGQEVMQFNKPVPSSFEIDLHQLTPGVYYLKVQDAEKRYSRSYKIIKE